MQPAARSRFRIAATLLLALAAASAFAQGDAGKVLRIGYQKAGLLAVLKAQGVLEQKLKPLGYEIKWFEFPAGPQLLEALNADSVDFGYTGAPPPIFAQAGGVRFVYVGAEPGASHNEAIFVKDDSPLRKPADLKGKRVALQKGSSSHYLLLEVLKKAGLRYEDVQPVYLAPADARAAFESGNVDAWVVWDPYYASAQATLKVRTLADYGGIPTYSFYEATREFAQAHPDIVAALLSQLRATGQWVNTHPDETAALVAPKIGLELPIVKTWVRRVPYGATPVTDNVAALQQDVADSFYGARLIPQKLTVKDNVWQDKAAAESLSEAR
ncbi:sulfonate ABC transporter substrate-binding protein [Trinickia terrae]|uniref:Putative aliphatic sulfonates-binding protein n=1 Tax=Trinickia terrae TaxID=2571161 RepID=A0A4U1IGA4_9BURK|nr:sulfonate ABC transporter substrate-binding protein [Trinickia terrae]TKC92721.1 sulfonate ABC transporter substrate-binding protein [Trinickia terrae]